MQMDEYGTARRVCNTVRQSVNENTADPCALLSLTVSASRGRCRCNYRCRRKSCMRRAPHIFTQYAVSETAIIAKIPHIVSTAVTVHE